jgi:hypothetical protein
MARRCGAASSTSRTAICSRWRKPSEVGPRLALETAGELRGGGLKQGSMGAWRSRKTVSRKNLHFGGLKVGGWV